MRCRGAIPSPRHKLAAATPHVVKTTTPSQLLYLPTLLSFWLNDVDGDCVTAEEAFVKSSFSPEVFIADSEVLAWATAHGVLNGAVISDVLEWMHQKGFDHNGKIYSDGPATSVNWTDDAILRNAISRGPVKIGVAADQLEKAVPEPPTNGWLATGFAPDSNIDHCVSLCGFGTFAWLASKLGGTLPSGFDGSTSGYALFTWKSIGIIDRPSMLAITAEAWLRNPGIRSFAQVVLE